MTVLAVVADGPLLVLASDDSARGNPPAHIRQKLHPLSSRLPLAAAMGGVAGGPSWPAGVSVGTTLGRFRRAFDGEDPAAMPWALDPATYTVEDVARHLATNLHRTLGHLLTPAGEPGSEVGITGLVAGYSAGERTPVVVYFGLVHEAVLTVNVLMRGGVGGSLVLPKADTPERIRRPVSLADAVTLARELVQARIEAHARHPEAGRDAVGPVHTLALAPGGPPILAPVAVAA